MTGLTVADCSVPREQPRWALLDLLVEAGIGSVGARGWRSDDPWQWLAVAVLTRGGGLGAGGPGWRRLAETFHRGRRLAAAAPGGGERVDAVYNPREAGLRGELLGMLPGEPRPVVAVDFSQLLLHRGRELRSLRVQVGALLGVVRRYLWDRHLLLGGLEPGVLEWLRGFLGSVHVQASALPSDEALALRGLRRIILLDPAAPEPLTRSDVMGADAFIIGGIVDITPRPGATRGLRLRGFYTPRRLELRGSIHGVPSRLNAVAEIILKARYRMCGDVEKAILDTMSPRDARLRAYVELSRWSRGRRTRAPWSLYRELASWLPLRPRDFVRAARMAGLEVEPGGPPEEGEGG